MKFWYLTFLQKEQASLSRKPFLVRKKRNHRLNSSSTLSNISNLGHQSGISALIANAHLLISSDTNGVILIWNVRTMAQINAIEPFDQSGVTSLAIWNNCIVASYANGMIRFFDPENGEKKNSIFQMRISSFPSSPNLWFNCCSCKMYQCN